MSNDVPPKPDLTPPANSATGATASVVQVLVHMAWSPSSPAQIKLSAKGNPITADPVHGDQSESPYERSANWHAHGATVAFKWTVGVPTDGWVELFARSAEASEWKSLKSKYVKANLPWSSEASYYVP